MLLSPPWLINLNIFKKRQAQNSTTKYLMNIKIRWERVNLDESIAQVIIV